MSDILTREEFEVCVIESVGGFWPDTTKQKLLDTDAALRAVIKQAVADVEKMGHGEMCQSNADWRNPPACDCGHAAAIANLKKGLGEKS